jgi:hypothetical protein
MDLVGAMLTQLYTFLVTANNFYPSANPVVIRLDGMNFKSVNKNLSSNFNFLPDVALHPRYGFQF